MAPLVELKVHCMYMYIAFRVSRICFALFLYIHVYMYIHGDVHVD